jgi:hypothetical protein
LEYRKEGKTSKIFILLVPDIGIEGVRDTLGEVKRIKLIFNVYLYELKIMDEDEDAIRD